MPSVLVLNGPNLNMLGTRQPEVYGSETLADLEDLCRTHGATIGLDVTCAQSNHEGVLLDHIHTARGVHDGLVINAGAFTHTSIALMDAVISVSLPCVEVHMSNIHARESFRHHSYLAAVSFAQICGMGIRGYTMALDGMAARLDTFA